MVVQLVPLLLDLFLLAYHVSASPVPVSLPARSPAGVVRMPMSKRGAGSLARRQTVDTGITSGHEDAQFGDTQGYYYVTVEVGTPAQSLDILVDTGSSDTWVYGSGYCGVQNSCGTQNECCR